MRVRLAYGRTGLDVDLPERNLAGVLRCRPGEPLADPLAAVRRAIERPNGSPPLRELARGRRNACVAVSDVTRPVPNRVLLPPVIETLEAAGIARHEILILVATGLHRPNQGSELVEMLGPEVAGNYRVENHHGRGGEKGTGPICAKHPKGRSGKLDLSPFLRREEHDFLGFSPRGLPVWIDSRYVRSELKITTGLIEPHFMAGFSGGRKLICPGLAALETVVAWHGPDFIEHANARSGCLDGNPVHEESTAIARMAGCDFIVNAVTGGEMGTGPICRDQPSVSARPQGASHKLDLSPSLLHVAAGEMEAAFLEGVAFARRHATATLPAPADIVVTTGAGYPLDATFYQSVKGMVAALPVVKPGGTVILAAGLSEGIGSPEFQRLFDDYPTLDAFMERLLGRRKGDRSNLCEAPEGRAPTKGRSRQIGPVPFSPPNFVMDQWQLEEMAKVCRRAKVKVVSDGLPPEMLRRLMVEPAESVEAAVAEALAEYGPQAAIAVIPEGPYVLAESRQEGRTDFPVRPEIGRAFPIHPGLRTD